MGSDRNGLSGVGLLLAASLLLVATYGVAQESTHEDQPAPANVEDLRGPFQDAFEAILRREPLFPRTRTSAASRCLQRKAKSVY